MWLNQYNNLHIANDGVFVYSTVKGANASFKVEATVENQNFSSVKATVSIYIADRKGKIVGRSPEQPLALKANESATYKQSINLTNPNLWSIEDPYLYRVISIVKQNGKVIDSAMHRFGVRTINIKPNGVFLNEKHIKLKGTNNHQDHAGVGSALPDYLQYYRIRLLKDLG